MDNINHKSHTKSECTLPEMRPWGQYSSLVLNYTAWWQMHICMNIEQPTLTVEWPGVKPVTSRSWAQHIRLASHIKYHTEACSLLPASWCVKKCFQRSRGTECAVVAEPCTHANILVHWPSANNTMTCFTADYSRISYSQFTVAGKRSCHFQFLYASLCYQPESP